VYSCGAGSGTWQPGRRCFILSLAPSDARAELLLSAETQNKGTTKSYKADCCTYRSSVYWICYDRLNELGYVSAEEIANFQVFIVIKNGPENTRSILTSEETFKEI